VQLSAFVVPQDSVDDAPVVMVAGSALSVTVGAEVVGVAPVNVTLSAYRNLSQPVILSAAIPRTWLPLATGTLTLNVFQLDEFTVVVVIRGVPSTSTRILGHAPLHFLPLTNDLQRCRLGC
jgi:hypothetical protein